VRTAIAQVIATAAKHDLANNAWPQLFAFITQNVNSEVPQEREVSRSNSQLGRSLLTTTQGGILVI